MRRLWGRYSCEASGGDAFGTALCVVPKQHGRSIETGAIMDFDEIMKWLGLIGGILGIANMAWILVNRGTKDFTEKQDKHETKLIDHDRRIQTVEGELKHMPTKDQVHTLQNAVTKLEGHMGKVESEVTSTAHLARRIDEFLRETAK